MDKEWEGVTTEEVRKELVGALRQYCHNNGDGLVFGYDEEETQKVVKLLMDQVRGLESELKVWKQSIASQHEWIHD